ncbi:extracellular solute-binding protein [Synechococcus sp. CS-205]|uniref:extracellular solute-binding protein n=1 Tax=Synechococcus sp. CS-205 TaxID=2847984 RepID=UPI00223AA0CB|nr:extracellular solute-binding protein [Synechococcus sp. CS-205]MCT0247742.1 extracellular solute-binding protein [Synechococcus sp. CS-205]
MQLLAAMAVLLATGGCGSRLAPDTLYISIETDINSESLKELSEIGRISRPLVSQFRALNPGVDVHVRHLPMGEVMADTRFRDSRGLGPDLIVSNVITALQLQQDGLISTVALKDLSLSRSQPPRFVNNFRKGSQVFAVPVLAQPQVACYDRRRLAEPPGTVKELLALSAKGLRVGLPLRVSELFWTTTPQGAGDAVVQLLNQSPAGKAATLSAIERRALKRWITWVYDSSLQKNVSFSDDPLDLVRQLQQGERDWISCSSLWIDDLRQKLGQNLGVSVLPGGPDAPAEPISRLLVWSFGRHSSWRQRQAAERFVAFSLNQVNQKQLMHTAPGNLPVNPDVLIPTRSSALLRTLTFSLDHSLMLDFRDPDAAMARGSQLESMLKNVVQGEVLPPEALARLLAPAP